MHLSLHSHNNSLYRMFVVIILYAALPISSHGMEIHSPHHCLAGCPSGDPDTNDLIIRTTYIVSTNDLTKMPSWVAYKVTKESIGKPSNPELRIDPLLHENETLEPEDYTNIKQEIGMLPVSLVPFTSFAGTPYWKEIEYMSNVIPMASDMVLGAWSDLEQHERELAKTPEIFAVYVITGTVFDTLQPLLPHADEIHMVPSGVWKIIAIKQAGKIKTAAFYFSQTDSRDMGYCSLMTTIDNIEERTGLDFFHELSYTEQIKIEQTLPSLRTEIGC